MNILLVKIHEPLPIDSGNPRLLRMALLAKELEDRGHSVTFWTSNFDYRSHRNRFETDTKVEVSKKYEIVLRSAPIYRKHISLRRLFHNLVLSSKLKKDLKRLENLDLIICAFPIIELASVCASFGRRKKIPVIVDVRDLWPDIFEQRLPKLLKLVGTPVIAYWRLITQKAFAYSTGLTAISPGILEWSQNMAGRAATSLDGYFYHGYPTSDRDSKDILQSGDEKLNSVGINWDRSKFTVCYLGQLTGTLNFSTVAEGMRILQASNPQIQLIVCGTGDMDESFKKMVQGLSNVCFTGWIGYDEGAAIMESCQAALICYNSTPDYELSIPNKIPEYLAWGLPVLCSIDGYPRKILEDNRCGIYYKCDEVSSFIEKMNYLFESEVERKEMAYNAKALFASGFAADVVYQAMSSHCENVVKSSRMAD